MGQVLFGADSLLERSTLDVSVAADADFPTANLSDDRLFTKYKMGSAVTELLIKTDAGVGNTDFVNYWMIAGHDFFDPEKDGNGAVLVEAQDSPDDAIYTTVWSVTPIGNTIIARTRFSGGGLKRFHRLRLTRGAAFKVSIGQIKWGSAVRPGRGVSVGFDPNDETITGQVNRSRTGNLLGSVRAVSNRRARVRLDLLTGTFVNNTTAPTVGTTDDDGFKHFWDTHASKLRPFLFHWSIVDNFLPGQFERDAFFARIDPGAGINRPLRTSLNTDRKDLEFSVVGLKE